MAVLDVDWLDLEVGDGRYLIQSKLGEGGMGYVFKAFARNLETEVVIKVPRRSQLENEEAVARFEQEIRSLVRLAHPHVVKILDVGKQDGLPFAVMQFLAGGSLEERRPKRPDGAIAPMALGTLSAWLPHVAGALDFVHSQGYIHRDVKPANILFDQHDNVYLGDFGIAKALAVETERHAAQQLTGDGLVMGTSDYMAPEVILGKDIDGRADQYSLAVMIYELLSGELPFAAPTASASMVKKATNPAPPFASVMSNAPNSLCKSIDRALTMNPHSRFATCSDFASAVAASMGKKERVEQHRSSPPRTSVNQSCPECGAILMLTARVAGKRAACPSCGAKLLVSEDLSTVRNRAVPPAVPAAPSVESVIRDSSVQPSKVHVNTRAIAPPGLTRPELPAESTRGPAEVVSVADHFRKIPWAWKVGTASLIGIALLALLLVALGRGPTSSDLADEFRDRAETAISARLNAEIDEMDRQRDRQELIRVQVEDQLEAQVASKVDEIIRQRDADELIDQVRSRIKEPVKGDPSNVTSQAQQLQESLRNLRNIGLAIQKFHDAHGRLPPAIVYGPDGRPWHSWRVLILPFLGDENTYSNLYAAYDFGRPWDDPTNLRIQELMPTEYFDPVNPDTVVGHTHYAAVVGKETLFPPEGIKMTGGLLNLSAKTGRGVTWRDVQDGRRHTVMVAPVSALKRVPWTKPEDLQYARIAAESKLFPYQFAAPYKEATLSGGPFLFADGTTETLRDDCDLMILRAMCTIAGGELFNRRTLPTLFNIQSGPENRAVRLPPQ